MKKSAGLLPFRESDSGLEVFLVHPGGPFWAKKDDGAWSIPKGKLEEAEDPLAAAQREFEEETGFRLNGEFLALQPVKQAGGKLVLAWAVRADFDATAVRSNTFSIEWPPRSGRQREFPEIDRADWFSLKQARQKMLPAQTAFLNQLAVKLGHASL